ncbi:hypothetical protein QC762_0003270 [Podospora pseudocomata]|uniref:Uncharacterized protein n=1 Tax=Podospora pseudocomata TaxID=2093779 RepID=A0ABR0GTI9_9PEZI|nr:hypothetical protein QC762_0003270 [Podospora pseudocomata]
MAPEVGESRVFGPEVSISDLIELPGTLFRRFSPHHVYKILPVVFHSSISASVTLPLMEMPLVAHRHTTLTTPMPWQDFEPIGFHPDGLPRGVTSSLGSHSPTGTYPKVLSLGGSSGNGWTIRHLRHLPLPPVHAFEGERGSHHNVHINLCRPSPKIVPESFCDSSIFIPPCHGKSVSLRSHTSHHLLSFNGRSIDVSVWTKPCPEYAIGLRENHPGAHGGWRSRLGRT